MSLEVSPTTGFTYLFDNVNDNLYEKSKNPIIFAVLISIIIIYVHNTLYTTNTTKPFATFSI